MESNNVEDLKTTHPNEGLEPPNFCWRMSKSWWWEDFELKFGRSGDFILRDFLNKSYPSKTVDSTEIKGTPKGLVLRSDLESGSGHTHQPWLRIFLETFFLFFFLSLSVHSFLSFLFSPLLFTLFSYLNRCFFSSFIWNKTLQTLTSKVRMQLVLLAHLEPFNPLVFGVFLMNLVEVMWLCVLAMHWEERKGKCEWELLQSQLVFCTATLLLVRSLKMQHARILFYFFTSDFYFFFFLFCISFFFLSNFSAKIIK